MKKIFLFLIMFALIISLVYAADFEFQTTNDKLDINEFMGDVLLAISESEISELSSGSITTQEGSTEYNQFLRFKDIASPLQSARVIFDKSSEDNLIADYLYIESGTSSSDAFIEYELEFESGLKSEIKNNKLVDIQGETIKIFDKDYIFVKTVVNPTSKEVELTLASGAVDNTLKEGETKTVAIDGVSYAVEAVLVQSTPKEQVKININGEPMGDIDEGQVIILEDGTVFGVVDILVSTGGSSDIIEFFIGKESITLEDKDYSDTDFENRVSLNLENLPKALVQIKASTPQSDILKISHIKYRLNVPVDTYVGLNKGVKDYLSNPKARLANWDIIYKGLENVQTNEIRFASTGSEDQYILYFTNNEGSQYITPFASNEGGTFKLGDSTKDLIVAESTSNTNFIVDQNDFFVLTTANTQSGKTYIFKYNSIDTSASTINVQDLSGDSKNIIYTNTSITGALGEATLTEGSISASIVIEDATGNKLAVDLNGDDTFDGSAVDIVAENGAVIDLGTTNSISSPYAIQIKTPSSLFEENTTDEDVTFNIESRTNNAIGIDTSFTGLTLQNQGDYRLGLTSYGAYYSLYDSATGEAEDLTINFPEEQVFARVSVSFTPQSQVTTSSQTTQTPTITNATCANGKQDGDETGTDCGGSCPACGTCSDGLQNQGETDVDCGGPCDPCQAGPEEFCATGCKVLKDSQEICLAFGEVYDGQYCFTDKQMKKLLLNGNACTAAYQCKSAVCEDNKCGRAISPMMWVINIVVLFIFVALIFYLARFLKE